MIPLPFLYYGAVFVIGVVIGRLTKDSPAQSPQAAESVMDGIAKLAASGALESIGDLEVKGGSEADGVQIKLTTREVPPAAAPTGVVSLASRRQGAPR